MAKATSHFVCQSCGTTSAKWAGKCEGCGEWNSFVEEAIPQSVPKGLTPAKGMRKLDFVSLEGSEARLPRRTSGIAEFDRVTGGGLVAGSVLLVGGDPGIGKSTLLLQVVGKMAAQGNGAGGDGAGRTKCTYISGEEATAQVQLRAARLGLASAKVDLASATSVRDIVSTLEATAPDLVIIDSIQTMYIDQLDSAPGTVAQVRASAHELIRLAKRTGMIVVLVGHVTKEGTLAGPRVLEHMVDAVLYFEGERGHQFRILRTVKNRYGPTDEIGVFEMTDAGLAEVPNPSALFLADRTGDVSGAVVFAGIEGTRPVLVEIQALVSPTTLGTPRRAVVGWDSARLSMIMAVLEARCGVQIGMNDVYLNVAGGLRITEPAADLAVAAALISALTGTPAPKEAVFFGEIGLSGEVRAVGQSELRLKEAAKLGFGSAFTPRSRKTQKGGADIKKTELDRLADILPLFAPLLASETPQRKRA